MSMSRHADEVTQGLVDWVRRHIPNTRVDAQPIGRDTGEDGIDIRLIALTPRFEPRQRDCIEHIVALDYLLTVRFADPLAEHRNLAELAFAAMETAGYEIVADRSPAEACAAIGLSPSAGIMLRAQARLSQELPRAPLVREPAIARLVPLGHVEGVVVGPGNVPIAGAFVTLEGDARAAVTGPDGRFRFATPAGTLVHLTARARSTEAAVSAEPGDPAVIQLPLEA